MDERKAILLAADCGDYDSVRSLDELEALCESAFIEVVAQVEQKRHAPDPATYLGSGRLEEAAQLAKNLEANLAVVDAELSGSQLKNIEAVLEIAVYDRTMLIIDIFNERAVTNEGKLQVELAKLQYRLPRLAGLGSALSRQGGGGGGGAGARRGGGESKLEYDRRYIRDRIDTLKQKLIDVEKRRAETRKRRKKNETPVIALVGYTNVGKSSLLNRICGSDVLEKNQLFATLDPTARSFVMPSGQAVIFVDTVGFVSRLPHNLVDAFKSTLEEAAYADVVVKVCDITSSAMEEELAVTNETLESIGANGIANLTVFNKCDGSFESPNVKGLNVSAKTGEGIPQLLAAIDDMLALNLQRVVLLVPYAKAGVISAIKDSGTVHKESYVEQGIYIEATVGVRLLAQLAPYYADEQV